jgi:hypothetical protein
MKSLVSCLLESLESQGFLASTRMTITSKLGASSSMKNPESGKERLREETEQEESVRKYSISRYMLYTTLILQFTVYAPGISCSYSESR